MRYRVLTNLLFFTAATAVFAGCADTAGSGPTTDGGLINSDAGGDGGGNDGGMYCSLEGYSCVTSACCQGYTCDSISSRCTPVSKQALGGGCTSNIECASGLCYNGNDSFTLPYCSRACKSDMDCVFESSTACCNGGTCEIISGAYCGDRSGGTGHGCSGGGSSDCTTGLFCSGTRKADGTFASDAICSKTCASTGECVDVKNPETLCLVCESGGSSSQKHCQVDLLCAGKCTSDSACTQEGERCSMQPVLNKSGKTVDLAWGCSKTCQWGGKKEYDEICLADGECCSPLCIRGRCVGACAADPDCGDGHLCEGLSIGLDPDDVCLIARLRMCVPFEGSAVACSANTDCAVNEYCQFAPDGSGLARSLCGSAPANGRIGGEPCSGSGSECNSMLCSSSGYCLDFCGSDADCPTKSGKMVCSLMDFGGGVARGLCLDAAGSHQSCTKDTDCPAGEMCEPFPQKGGSKTLCVSEVKTGKHPGEACTKSSTCSNELCLSIGLCSAVCAADADCPVTPGTAWLCGRIEIQSGSFFPGCIPVPGSGKPCKLDSDCTTGEACKYLQGPDGKSITVCGTETGNGAEKGARFSEPCTDCPDQCDRTCSRKNCYNDMCLGYGKCSETCQSNSDCGLSGWICARDPGSGLHYCTETGRVLCTSCLADADCLGTEENFCNDLQGGGRACGIGCDPKLVGSCPEGFQCLQVFSSDMTPRGYNCLPSSGSCPAPSMLHQSAPGSGEKAALKQRPGAITGAGIPWR